MCFLALRHTCAASGEIIRGGREMSSMVQCLDECEIKADELLYTQEFFAALLLIIDRRPQRCKSCRIADGDGGFSKDDTRKKFPAVLRLCVDNPAVALNIVSNIAMFCTRCRKPGQEWRTQRRIKPSSLPQLFEGGGKQSGLEFQGRK